MPLPDPRRRYEVMLQREGRWVLDEWMREEAEAVARAEELYSDETVEAVRVVRGRFSLQGRSFETTLYERSRSGPRRAPPIRIGAPPESAGWCETEYDLYGAESRRAIARLLRGFLDRYAITPTELMLSYRNIRLLDRQGDLMPSAVQRAAAVQAAGAGGAVQRARRDVLDRLVEAATQRARDLESSKAAPSLDAGGLGELAERTAALAVEPQEQLLLMRHAIVRSFEGLSGLGAKLDCILGLAGPDLPPRLLGLIDEFVAGLLASSELIKEVLGRQASLGAALMALADLALGRHDGQTANAPPALPILARLCAGPAMPETRRLLLERVARELGGERELGRDGQSQERQLLDEILDKVSDDRSLIAGGSMMIEAAARRARRLDIVGGIAALHLADQEPLARLDRLATLARTSFALRQQQAVATYMVETLDGFAGEPEPLMPLRDRIAATEFPPALKSAVLERLPQLAVLS